MRLRIEVHTACSSDFGRIAAKPIIQIYGFLVQRDRLANDLGKPLTKRLMVACTGCIS
jgi:hypothetical protein